MGEQEKYKNLLKKVIKETEDHKIKSTEEMVRALVNELGNSSMPSAAGGKSQSFAE
nr:hypothetical protein [Priestia megaterium]